MLEPDAGQLASPVLRGAQASNGLRLLDRGGGRLLSTVAAPFVWRCPSNLTVTPFPLPARRTERALLTHSALGQELMLSPMGGCGSAPADRPARVSRAGTTDTR